MADKLDPETIWYLKRIVELGENSLAEGKFYTHEQVREKIKMRFHK